MMDAFKV
jgi:phosphatidylinositol kinase/protein kinase (PI-3  family)